MARAGHDGDGHGRAGRVLSGLAVAVGALLFLGGFAWGAVLYKPYTVPTDSMAPTIAQGNRVLAQRIDGADVRRGDVVVFQDKVWGNLPMVKRVVGTDGDKVSCCDAKGRLTVNGQPIEEPYLEDGSRPASPTGFSATVPEGQLFLLGDHRSDSVDSRVHLADGGQGSVPRSAVRARVDATAWPMAGWGMLGRPRSFAALPGGTSSPGPLPWVVRCVLAGAALILGGAAYGPVARLRAGRAARGGKAAMAGG
ncbi:signal peptidase I [Streptomyces olivoverticillatus]|uniref:Signal peptidase I n=1 Tax=Streptomyces olivoverticillatus TaxID=66427 RepID=A0A7W7LK44_9ACTN|nr:signal peptidase I [Streptomyces olivoverticillatus]MBB4891046.1 signal peptidase I [Streptomyces olivoverticillatus]